MFELVENLGSQRVLYCIIHVDKSILFERHERALLGFEDCLPPTPGGGEGGGGGQGLEVLNSTQTALCKLGAPV